MVKSGSFQVSQGSLAGRLGSGLGQGLADQIPKEVDRYRLSQGLKQFEKESANLTPFQQATKLMSIPGIGAEHIYALQPLLQQQKARQAQVDYGKSFSGNQNTKPAAKGQPAQRGIPAEKSITNLETEQALLEPNLPPTPQEINALAGQLIQDFPDKFVNPEQANAEASNLLSAEYNKTQALREQSKINDAAKTDIENEFNKVLGDLGANIPGEEKQKLLNQAYKDVGSSKKTKLQAANDVAKEGLKLAQGVTSLQTINKQWFPNPETARKSVNQLRQGPFKGNSELLYNKLQSEWGLTPGFAKTLSNPPSENKDYSEYLKSIPMQNLGGKEFLKNREAGYPREVKAADQMVKHLKPNDSILAGLVQMQGKGLDANAVMEQIRNLYNSDKISLSESQIKELSQPAISKPSVKDFWYMIMFGYEKLLGEK
jgi:hypothetical protein